MGLLCVASCVDLQCLSAHLHTLFNTVPTCQVLRSCYRPKHSIYQEQHSCSPPTTLTWASPRQQRLPTDVQGLPTDAQGYKRGRKRGHARQLCQRRADAECQSICAQQSLLPAHRPSGSSAVSRPRPAQSKLRYILWICRDCSPLRQVGQRLFTLTEARKQESQNTCLRALAARSFRAPARTQPQGAQVCKQCAPTRPARHLRHRLQAYGALSVGFGRPWRWLRRRKGQWHHPRPLGDRR